jgi:cytochrome b6-f complex iron-sulfur subunit
VDSPTKKLRMNESSNLTRRDFIKLSIKFLFGVGGLLGLGGLVRFLGYQSDPGPPSEFDLGEAAKYPVGSRTTRADIPAVIYNRAGKIAAYSLTCTHLGCTVEEDGEAYACPCHGSRFSNDGEVLKGPAQKSLRRLEVELQEDLTLRLYTHRGMK